MRQYLVTILNLAVVLLGPLPLHVQSADERLKCKEMYSLSENVAKKALKKTPLDFISFNASELVGGAHSVINAKAIDIHLYDFPPNYRSPEPHLPHFHKDKLQ